MKLKFKVYKNKKFLLELPIGWKRLLKERVYSFYNNKGSGVVQISIYAQQVNKVDLIDKLNKFMINKPFGRIIKRSIDKYDYAECSFIKEKFFTHVRILAKNSEFALLTYNCHADNLDEVELQIAKRIFDSFKFKVKSKDE